jgi:hypothetical protein
VTSSTGTYGRLAKAIDRFVRSGGGSGRRSVSAGAAIPPGMIGITIVDDSAENRKGLDRIFDAFGATIAELPAVLTDAVPTIRDAHRAVFTSEGAAGRGRWRPLAPSTLAERKRLGFGAGPILVRTGALRDHVLATPAVVTTRGDTVELRIQPDPYVAGVKKYAALAVGDSGRNLPGRPMVAVGPAAATKITSTIQRSLRARARANGLQ